MRELDHVIRKKDWIKMNQLLKQTQLRTPRERDFLVGQIQIRLKIFL